MLLHSVIQHGNHSPCGVMKQHGKYSTTMWFCFMKWYIKLDLGDVPYCFSRSSARFLDHSSRNIDYFDPNWALPDCDLNFLFTGGYEMMHKAESSIEEVLYYISRSSIKFQGHTSQKILDFDLNWSFPDRYSNSNLRNDIQTQLGVAQRRCSIVFHSHLLNFKVT